MKAGIRPEVVVKQDWGKQIHQSAASHRLKSFEKDDKKSTFVMTGTDSKNSKSAAGNVNISAAG